MVALIRLGTLLALAMTAPMQASPVDRWRPMIEEASSRFDVPTTWIEGVMRAESGGQTMLRGVAIRSPAGAIGLMQLMPGTWADMRSALHLGADPDNPHDNILAGTFYLRLMYDRFGYPGLFAAYNAGPGRYAGHLATGTALPAETRAYLHKVGGTAEPPPNAPGLFAIAPHDGRARVAVGQSEATLFVSLAGRAETRREGESFRGWGKLVSDLPSVTAGGTRLKARGCPPICCANRFPPRPLRGARACGPRGPDTRPADHRRGCALEEESSSERTMR